MKLSRTLRNTIKQVQKLIQNDLGIVKEDKYLVRVKGGTGGNGLARYNGVGGNGGSVYFITKQDMAFADIKKSLPKMVVRAEAGTSSQKIKLLGEKGADTLFDVPIGIDVVNEQNNCLIARCNRPYQRYLIAKGGEGGSPLNNFKGQRGDEYNISIHLKLRPNVGFVGFPNAGKSTLLQAFVPRKSIKIAPYPFTTVNPQVAFWTAPSEAEEPFTLSMADLPGLIEGAAKNRGKGHKFLKHLEYSEILCFVVDSLGFQLKNTLEEPLRTPLESIAILNKELEAYDPRLVRKPSILVLNKIDKVEDKKTIEDLATILRAPEWYSSLTEELRPISPIRFDYVLLTSARSRAIDEGKKFPNILLCGHSICNFCAGFLRKLECECSLRRPNVSCKRCESSRCPVCRMDCVLQGNIFDYYLKDNYDAIIHELNKNEHEKTKLKIRTQMIKNETELLKNELQELEKEHQKAILAFEKEEKILNYELTEASLPKNFACTKCKTTSLPESRIFVCINCFDHKKAGRENNYEFIANHPLVCKNLLCEKCVLNTKCPNTTNPLSFHDTMSLLQLKNFDRFETIIETKLKEDSAEDLDKSQPKIMDFRRRYRDTMSEGERSLIEVELGAFISTPRRRQLFENDDETERTMIQMV